MSQDTRQAALQTVLARSDAYVQGLVEAHSVCPFALPCRQNGHLWRAISWATELACVDRLVALTETLELHADDIEVGLLLMPGLAACSPREIDTMHRQLRDAYKRRSGGGSFYVVPFHPDYPCNDADAGSLVRYWRKSPDPTLQFVHIDTLEAVRRDSPRDQFSAIALRLLGEGRSPEEVVAELDAHPVRQGTSERVTQQNFDRFKGLGRPFFDELIANARRSDVPPIDSSWADVPFTRAT